MKTKKTKTAKTTAKTTKSTKVIKPIKKSSKTETKNVNTSLTKTSKELGPLPPPSPGSWIIIDEPIRGIVLNKPVTRFLYVRKTQGVPVGCIAYETCVKSLSETGMWIELRFGVSTQNPKDAWDKELGRTIAQRRMEKMKTPLLVEVKDNQACMRLVMEKVLDSTSADLTAENRDKTKTLRLARYLEKMLKNKFKKSGKNHPKL